jgi:hypothetical protein
VTFRVAFRTFMRRPRRQPVSVVRYAYVVRHQRIAVYWRDPYKRYKNAGDPRSDWTPHLPRAYKFAEPHHAEEALRQAGETGAVLTITRD